VTPGARDWLAIAGYDPAYGARPLRRLVQSAIGDKLARKLLAGEVRDGDRVVVDVDVENDSLVVDVERPTGELVMGEGPTEA
jgi:ATP-dependent Clp protease ATP-binding subunit ClpB